MRYVKICGLALMMALGGCSATKLVPESTAPTVYRTPIDGATAQLILPQSFQRLTITQKPGYGRAWSIFNFEAPIGQPMCKALIADLRSRVPSLRVGDRDDGKASTIKVLASDIAIEFGVDEGNAIFWTSVSLVGLASDVTVGAKVHLTTSVSINGGATRDITTTGLGVIPMAYGSLSKSDFGTALGLAVDDAALKLGDQIQAESAR